MQHQARAGRGKHKAPKTARKRFTIKFGAEAETPRTPKLRANVTRARQAAAAANLESWLKRANAALPTAAQDASEALTQRILATPGAAIGVAQTSERAVRWWLLAFSAGKLSLGELEEFLSALRSADPARVRVCPECGRLYYATRFNTQACEEHRALARLHRHRQKVGYYNAERRVRRRLGLRAATKREQDELGDLHDAIAKEGE
jgi:hypothetical protein